MRMDRVPRQVRVQRTEAISIMDSISKNRVRCLRYLLVGIFAFWIRGTMCTNRYYGTYQTLGSGDTMIQVYHAEKGPNTPHRKWHVECLDGEAVIGIQNFVNDFQKLDVIWCKFMFPYKPPTNGMYPFYPNCHVHNFTNQFFCFDPKDVSLTVNTFVVGFWDPGAQFFIAFPKFTDNNLYKCCRTPPGYYVDYTSCYYFPTHDQYWEFYDAIQQFIVFCNGGYVMTGISKKIAPYDLENHIEWIQCCRMGFQGFDNLAPPHVLRIARSVNESTTLGTIDDIDQRDSMTTTSTIFDLKS